MIKEPVAAALAYGLDLDEEQVGWAASRCCGGDAAPAKRRPTSAAGIDLRPAASCAHARVGRDAWVAIARLDAGQRRALRGHFASARATSRPPAAQVVLAFDLGGGTYDISLLEVGNGTIEVLSTGAG